MVRKAGKSTYRTRRCFRPCLQLLEARLVFASDFGDAPLPYKTLLAESGAEHVAIGPMLGTNRDTEVDGVRTRRATGDDRTGGPDDEDGVTFGSIRVGELGATAIVTVGGGSARLDAWIDFDRDGSFGGPWEQIADSVAVTPPFNTITFDVPSWAAAGTTYARFRLSQAGHLGVGGVAADGEVEDHAVTILPPKKACGCFTDKTISTAVDNASNVQAADVDGDGDTDIVSASGGTHWYENDGNQNFTVHGISTAGGRSVLAVDLDGDGDNDIISGGNQSYWHENNGSQSFTSHLIVGGVRRIIASDVDGDGDLDLLSTSNLNGIIKWHENDGSQNFTPHTIASNFNDDTFTLYAADVDSDGDMDVISSWFFDDEITWYENDGSQNFTPHAIIATGALRRPRSVFAADFDGDGDTDLLSASFWLVAWFENDGSQNFTLRVVTLDAHGPTSVFAADVDGDGDLDALSASEGDSAIAWYENHGNHNFTHHIITTAALRQMPP